jgi:hypothetical protein
VGVNGRWVREKLGHIENGGLAQQIAAGVVAGLQQRGIVLKLGGTGA